MNERIRELAEQAGIKITPFVVDGIEYEYEDVDMDGSEDLAKFAELIVEEMYVFMCNATDNDKPWPTFKEVKQHFGIE